ncbi:MAG: hypothetical protein ACYC8V_12110 [Caulobacteraceae bacterium]
MEAQKKPPPRIGALNNPRHEAFAGALARGASVRQATAEARLSPRHLRRMTALAASPLVSARTAEIRRVAPWGGSAELAGLFESLTELAGRAAGLGTGAAMVAAKELLAEAGRLHQRAARPAPPGRAQGLSLPPPMSTEEWIETFAPRPDAPKP